MNEVFHNLAGGFEVALTPVNLLYCLIGATLGTLVGILPGIGASATMAMLLPLTFKLSPVASIIMLSLFVQREATSEVYASPVVLWLIVPLLLFWQCRLWLSTSRGYMHDDPIVYAARDWVSWLIGLAAAGTVIVAHLFTF